MLTSSVVPFLIDRPTGVFASFAFKKICKNQIVNKIMNSSNISKSDNAFYAEIRELLQQARNTAYQAANTLMVNTYWQIGQRIVEQEQHGKNRAGYGDYLITNLSRYLSDTLGKGFSEANLWNMRQFYLTFPEFSTRRVENLAWSHYRLKIIV